MPAGWRTHQRVVQIVREEMNAIGGLELLMPILQPAELWKRSGRYEGFGEELFKLKDRKDAEMVLAPTSEEAVTTHAAGFVRSYRDLPKILYHFQTKERDEPRPRAAVLRSREFVMKDSYSFDRDREGLDASYEKHARAYDRIFDRCGLEWYSVEADVGAMGGFGAHEYMAPCPAGENDVVLAPGYAANLEVARADAQAVQLPLAPDAPAEVSTPGLVRRIVRARDAARRPQGQRRQARARTGLAVAPGQCRGDRAAARAARIDRTRWCAGADSARRGRRRRRRRLRGGRQPPRPAPVRRGARP
jgi:prolyl-tRNA synthetase